MMQVALILLPLVLQTEALSRSSASVLRVRNSTKSAKGEAEEAVKAVNVTGKSVRGTGKTSSAARSGANISGHAFRPYPASWPLPNTACINYTGYRCWEGAWQCPDSYSSCTPEKWCACPSWGCGSAEGICKPVHNKWLDVLLRIAPAAARSDFVAMASDGGESGPYLHPGWPEDPVEDGIWDLLVQHDNVSVLLSTKKNRDSSHAHFLDVDDITTSPQGELFMLSQRKPYDALQAAWNLVLLPHSKIGLRHARTARWLQYDSESGQLTTCISPDCKPGSGDFDFWPKIVSDQEPCETCETPYRLGPQSGPNVPTHTPWYLKPFEGWGLYKRGKSPPDTPWYLKKQE